MSDNRRDFLLRIAAAMTVVSATAGHGAASEVQVKIAQYGAVYGPPPTQRVDEDMERFSSEVGNSVYFAADKTTLSADARVTLDRQITWLSRNTGYAIILESHTDEKRSPEYCLALSERQGQSVRDYMTAHGIAPQRISVVGYGKERPMAVGGTEAARARNRRVDIRLQ